MGRLTHGRKEEKKSTELAPIWRGIGCIMFAVLTIVSYFAADALIDAINVLNRNQPFLPGGLRRGIPNDPVVLYDYKFPQPAREIGPIKLDRPITNIPIQFKPVQLAITLVVSIVMFGLSVVVWGILNPPKLGPRDAPPPRRRARGDNVR
jgi:hypothetical protein